MGIELNRLEICEKCSMTHPFIVMETNNREFFFYYLSVQYILSFHGVYYADSCDILYKAFFNDKYLLFLQLIFILLMYIQKCGLYMSTHINSDTRQYSLSCFHLSWFNYYINYFTANYCLEVTFHILKTRKICRYLASVLLHYVLC